MATRKICVIDCDVCPATFVNPDYTSEGPLLALALASGWEEYDAGPGRVGHCCPACKHKLRPCNLCEGKTLEPNGNHRECERREAFQPDR